MWTAVVKDFGFLLDEYDRDHDGPEDDARVAIESLRESCLALQAAGKRTMRVCQGGHDVADDKLRARFERTLANLQRAIERLSHLIVFNNQELNNPYQLIATYENGRAMD